MQLRERTGDGGSIHPDLQNVKKIGSGWYDLFSMNWFMGRLLVKPISALLSFSFSSLAKPETPHIINTDYNTLNGLNYQLSAQTKGCFAKFSIYRPVYEFVLQLKQP